MDVDPADDEEDSAPSLLEFLPSDVLLELFKFVEWHDLCQLSQTCIKFHQICQSTTLWLSLKTLDFRHCAVPDGEKILQILQRTPHAEHLILGDVIIEEPVPVIPPGEDDLEYEDDERDLHNNNGDPDRGDGGGPRVPQNIVGHDKFVLDVVKMCPQLTCIDLYMHEISARAVEAICAKCSNLVKFHLHDNEHVDKRAITDLVSYNESLTELVIEGCEGISFPSIKHTEPAKHLTLTHISLLYLMIISENVETLIRSCPMLQSLDLTGSIHLDRFSVNISQGQQKTGLDTLQHLILKECKEVKVVSIPYCPCLQTLDLSQGHVITEVKVTGPQLTNLTLEGCVCMKTIELSVSDIGQLVCTNMEDLEVLQIGSNQLHSLDVSQCTRISSEQLLTAVTDKSSLTYLNICGCKNIPPAKVDAMLPQFTGLKRLKYGGHSWNSVSLSSDSLAELEFSTCVNTTCLVLNMRTLRQLRLHNCRDFSEQELMDSLLYGRHIEISRIRLQGLESLIDTSCKNPPFHDNAGVPDLEDLQCHDMPGLHGDKLSHSLKYFTHLTTLKLVHCTFLSHLCVDDWPSLTYLQVESCNRLNKLTVQNASKLSSLCVKWCSLVQTCTLTCPSLETVDMTGTNYVHLRVTCDKLHKLALHGVCTQTQHTVCLQCKNLEELSISKCDRLTDVVLQDIVNNSPHLHTLNIIGSLSLSHLTLPSSISTCSLTGHRLLRDITLQSPVNIHHLTLNNLAKLVPSSRQQILAQCQDPLHILEVRAIPGETTLVLSLHQLTSLTLDQGIHLAHLEIVCPKLKYLRIQGCPKLESLDLHVENLSQVQVYHSTPLLALRRLALHCTKVMYLSRVLAFYCPKLEELRLHRAELRETQLYRLGQSLHNLHTLSLYDSNVKDMTVNQSHIVINSSAIYRTNDKHLTVQFLNS